MPRTVSYDVQDVTERAMQLFWARGFSATSVEDLVEQTGLNRHSLYQHFGGKVGLFNVSLQCYREQQASPYLAALNQVRGIEALRAYFSAIAQNKDRRGCLIANSAMDTALPAKTRELIKQHYQVSARALAAALQRGQAQGEIDPKLNPKDSADWLLAVVQGLSMQARFGQSPKLKLESLLALLAA